MTTRQQRINEIIGEMEDAPQAEWTYRVTIGAQTFLVRAIDSAQAERRARAQYRKALRMEAGSATPSAQAYLVQTPINPRQA